MHRIHANRLGSALVGLENKSPCLVYRVCSVFRISSTNSHISTSRSHFQDRPCSASSYFNFFLIYRQVVSGGRYDVDVTLESPTGEEIYRQIKTQFDSYQFTASVRKGFAYWGGSQIQILSLVHLLFHSNIFGLPAVQATGIYTACFSNEFSTFSHKIVYMDFQVGEEQPLPGIEEHATVLTQLESSAQEIHKALNAILDYQTHHRLREAQGENEVLFDCSNFPGCWTSFECITLLYHFVSCRPKTCRRFERTCALVVAH